MPQNLVALFRHNRWATRQLMAFCTQLTDAQLDYTAPGVYGSIRATWDHIVRNEESYTALLAEGAWQPTPAAADGLAGLAERAERAAAALIDLAAHDHTARILKGEWRGQPYSIPAVIPLTQAIHHANEHRAQIATLLTLQGFNPPVIDAWTYDKAGMPD
jgi:uncharacterized damage-inducible protein DinB